MNDEPYPDISRFIKDLFNKGFGERKTGALKNSRRNSARTLLESRGDLYEILRSRGTLRELFGVSNGSLKERSRTAHNLAKDSVCSHRNLWISIGI